MSQPVPCLCSVMVTHNAPPPAGSASQACKRKRHMLCREHTHTHTHTHTVSPSLRVCDPLITKPTTFQHHFLFCLAILIYWPSLLFCLKYQGPQKHVLKTHTHTHTQCPEGRVDKSH